MINLDNRDLATKTPVQRPSSWVVAAVKNAAVPWQNFEALTSSSDCDNVLLERRFAHELHARQLLDGMFPVYIGDEDASQGATRKPYVLRGAASLHPVCSAVVVAEVEKALCAHLEDSSLGTPYERDTGERRGAVYRSRSPSLHACTFDS